MAVPPAQPEYPASAFASVLAVVPVVGASILPTNLVEVHLQLFWEHLHYVESLISLAHGFLKQLGPTDS